VRRARAAGRQRDWLGAVGRGAGLVLAPGNTGALNPGRVWLRPGSVVGWGGATGSVAGRDPGTRFDQFVLGGEAGCPGTAAGAGGDGNPAGARVTGVMAAEGLSCGAIGLTVMPPPGIPGRPSPAGALPG